MLDGILNVYKEKGYTSHDVVAKLRGIAGQRKIGHTGTLDPDAEGVLPVCLGKATKVCDVLTDKTKAYETVLLLGKRTDTQDITGACLEEKDTSFLTDNMVREAVESFQGDYMQVPPMYSALKVNGKKLYELAREGKTVERKPRKVILYSIQVKKMDLPRVWMDVECSKGTYIRTLCEDIGRLLGTGGCMEQLKRTRVGNFCIGDSMTLADLQKCKEEGKLEECLLPIDAVFDSCRKITVSKNQETLLYNGNRILASPKPEDIKDGEMVRMYDQNDRFIALYRYDETEGSYRNEKMFFSL